MAKYTTELYDIITSELEMCSCGCVMRNFRSPNAIHIFTDHEQSFINRIYNFDDCVYRIVNKFFFGGWTLDDIDNDREFKRTFTTTFLYRQISRQTVDHFRSVILSISLQNGKYINELYENLKQYMHMYSNDVETFVKDFATEGLTDFRNLASSFPDNTPNMNLDDDNMSYPDSNDMAKSRGKGRDYGTSTTTNTHEEFNPNYLRQMQSKIAEVFQLYERGFLQLW